MGRRQEGSVRRRDQAGGPDLGWEVSAAAGTANGRTALAIALSDMMAAGEITRDRAQEIAMLVLRGNASRLYKLGLR